MKKVTAKKPAKAPTKKVTATVAHPFDEILNSLDKMIDTLIMKKNLDEEMIVKISFEHLGFLIALTDGEKELNDIVAGIKKEVKDYQKFEKEEVALEKIASTKASKAPAATKKGVAKKAVKAKTTKKTAGKKK